MTLTDWLRARAARPQDNPADAPAPVMPPAPLPPGPVATAATAASAAAEDFYRSVRAPWVPSGAERPVLGEPENKRVLAAFDRDALCPVCSPRYSRCYCPRETS